MKKIMILLLICATLSVFADRDGVVQCANLIYGGTHTSRCFSDEFLSVVQKKTAIPTERRFKSVKLSSKELFKFPFAMMTGEKNFLFTIKERKNLKDYLTKGGFLLASAGCSNKEFNKSFRMEIKRIFPKKKLEAIKMNHPLFRTVNKIKKLNIKSETATKVQLEGLTLNGKLVMVYSPHGLNNTANTKGCCCCGGNEILNALDINVNVLVYAILH
jgi:Domain of unknown function (DUF4159)